MVRSVVRIHPELLTVEPNRTPSRCAHRARGQLIGQRVQLSRRVGKVVGCPPLIEMSAEQRREFHEALLAAQAFEDLVGKWQAATLEAEKNRPALRAAKDD